ncbi:unnamed protein product, partial [Mesorhabditis spiculigera]
MSTSRLLPKRPLQLYARHASLQAKASSSSAQIQTPYALFPTAVTAAPHFDLSRTVNTSIAELYYRRVEPEYSRESFLQGAMEAASIASQYIVDKNWNGLSNICVTDLVDMIRERCEAESALIPRIAPGDVLCSYLYSALISGKQIYRLNPGNTNIYLTAMVFCRNHPDVPQDLSLKKYLAKYYKEITVCHITFARAINPPGIWKATQLNYFNLI